MQQQNEKGRFLSDTLKLWHVVLLVLLMAGLVGTQWWMNSKAADQQAKAQEQPKEILE